MDWLQQGDVNLFIQQGDIGQTCFAFLHSCIPFFTSCRL